MDVSATLREARHAAHLSQATLAARVGTSQATLSAYESGRKAPGVDTLARLLAAMGLELRAEPAGPRAVEPSRTQLARAGRQLVDVLALAEALPTRHEPELRFPRLVSRAVAAT